MVCLHLLKWWASPGERCFNAAWNNSQRPYAMCVCSATAWRRQSYLTSIKRQWKYLISTAREHFMKALLQPVNIAANNFTRLASESMLNVARRGIHEMKAPPGDDELWNNHRAKFEKTRPVNIICRHYWDISTGSANNILAPHLSSLTWYFYMLHFGIFIFTVWQKVAFYFEAYGIEMPQWWPSQALKLASFMILTVSLRNAICFYDSHDYLW